jgi:hypothetical protein
VSHLYIEGDVLLAHVVFLREGEQCGGKKKHKENKGKPYNNVLLPLLRYGAVRNSRKCRGKAMGILRVW